MTENEMAGCYQPSMGTRLKKLQEIVREKKAWQAVAHGLAKSQESDMI